MRFNVVAFMPLYSGFAQVTGEGDTREDAELDAVNQLSRNLGYPVYVQDCKFWDT